MVRQCVEKGSSFGIVLIDDGKLADTGCEVGVTSMTNEQPTGEFDITVEGKRRFKLGAISNKDEYLSVEALWKQDEYPELESERIAHAQALERLITQHMKLLELAGRTVRPHMYEGDKDISFVIAHNSGMTAEQKQFLLDTDKVSTRVSFLTNHLQKFISRVEQFGDFRKKISSDGHFRDFPPEIDA